MSAEGRPRPRGWVCPNDPNDEHRDEHRVKWNSGYPWCLTCDRPAVWRDATDKG